MTLALVRHLATEWTVAGRLQGRRDEPILPAAEPGPPLRQGLAQFRGTKAWCSTLRRTRETAQRCGWMDPTESPLLDELDFGRFEGRLRDELLAETGGKWVTAPFETELAPALADLDGRIEAFLGEVRAGRGPSIVFGHGVWIRLLVAKVRDGDGSAVNRIQLDPGALIEVAL